MANIAINNYCNLKCKYCFADDMIHEETTTITPQQFEELCLWILQIEQPRIGIIGGEPTLHPHFDEILTIANKVARDFNTSFTLFTNGINLDKFIPQIGERISILINCNTPKFMTTDNYDKMIKCFDHLSLLSWFGNKVTLGCNLYMELDDYSYIWELCDKYHLTDLRTSVTAPNPNWKMNKEEYYIAMKPKFLNFCKDAYEHHVNLCIDCGHIPQCYFNSEELELINSVSGDFYVKEDYFCEPVVDITSNYEATACFGSWDPIDIRDFDNLHQLERFLLLKKSYPRALNNCSGKCSTCKKHELLTCQGGCLGFANMGGCH